MSDESTATPTIDDRAEVTEQIFEHLVEIATGVKSSTAERVKYASSTGYDIQKEYALEEAEMPVVSNLKTKAATVFNAIAEVAEAAPLIAGSGIVISSYSHIEANENTKLLAAEASGQAPTVSAPPPPSNPAALTPTSSIVVDASQHPVYVSLGAAFDGVNITATDSGSSLVLSTSAGGQIVIQNWNTGAGFTLALPDGSTLTASNIASYFQPAEYALTYQAGTAGTAANFVSVASSLGSRFADVVASSSFIPQNFATGGNLVQGVTEDGSAVYSETEWTSVLTPYYYNQLAAQGYAPNDVPLDYLSTLLADPKASAYAQVSYDYWTDAATGETDFIITNEVTGFGNITITNDGTGATSLVPVTLTSSYSQSLSEQEVTPAVDTVPLYSQGNSSSQAASFATPYTQIVNGLRVTTSLEQDGVTWQTTSVDSSGNVVQTSTINSSTGAFTTIDYSNGQLTQEWQSDGQGNLLAIVKVDGTTTTTESNSNGKSVLVQSGTSIWSNAIYDADGDLTTYVSVNGSSTSNYSFNPENGTFAYATDDGNGNTYSDQFDGKTRTITQVFSDQSGYTQVYDAGSQALTTNTYLAGHVLDTSIVEAGATVTESDYEGGVLSSVTTTNTLTGATSESDYSFGRVVEVTTADGVGNSEVQEYGQGGLISDTFFNANNTSSGTDYTDSGSVSNKWTQDATGLSNATTYDSFGDVTGIGTYRLDGSGFGTDYDGFGNIVDTWTRDQAGNDTYTLPADGSGTVIVETLNSTGAVVSKTSQGSAGNSAGTTYSTNGTFTVWTNDGHGDLTSKTYTSSNVLLSDAWQNSDGTAATDTFDATGFKTADTWKHADGTSGQDTYAQDGSSTTKSYNASGVLVSTSYVNADGSYGSWSLDVVDGTQTAKSSDGVGDSTTTITKSDGSSSTQSVLSNGTTIVNADDGHGDWSSTTFNADGSSSGAWQDADGSYGVSSTTANGYCQSRRTAADGSVTTTSDDGRGNTYSSTTFADGTQTTSWQQADGTHVDSSTDAEGLTTSHTHYADGSIAVNTDDGHGDYTGTTTFADGTSVSAWQQADGSHGNASTDVAGDTTTDTYASDGSLTAVTQNVDGSGSSETFNAQNTLVAFAIYGADGSSSTYSADADGSTKSTYVNADGSHGDSETAGNGDSVSHAYGADGSETTNATTVDALGNSTFTVVEPDGSTQLQKYNAQGILEEEDYLGADGSKSAYLLNADGSSVSSYVNSDGSYGDRTTQANGQSLAHAYGSDGTLVTTIGDGQGDTTSTTTYADGSYGSGYTLADGSGHLEDHFADGTLWDTSTWDSQGNDTYSWYRPDGSLAGQGTWSPTNGSDQTAYNLDGSTNEQVSYSDGSSEVILTNADGSYSDIAYYADGTVSRDVAVDSQGNGTNTQYFDGGGVQGTSTWALDGTSDTVAYSAPNVRAFEDIESLTGSEWKWYDNSGQLITDNTFFNDGSSQRLGWYADGTLVVQRGASDGSSSTFWTGLDYSSGTIQIAADGSAAGTYLDANGQTLAQLVEAPSTQGATLQGGGDTTPSLLIGGAGNDILSGGTVYSAGSGDNIINLTPSGQPALVLFDSYGGQDTVNGLGAGAAATISLGGNDLEGVSLSRSGSDLVLHDGSATETFADWYASGTHQATLQLILMTGDMTSYFAEQVNLDDFAQAFDAAQAANPSVQSLQLSDALSKLPVSSTPGMALGGDLAINFAEGGTIGMYPGLQDTRGVASQPIGALLPFTSTAVTTAGQLYLQG